jgi:hypothetical protein
MVVLSFQGMISLLSGYRSCLIFAESVTYVSEQVLPISPVYTGGGRMGENVKPPFIVMLPSYLMAANIIPPGDSAWRFSPT